MLIKIKKEIKTLIWVGIFILFSPAISHAGPFDYKLLEDFPGFFKAGEVLVDLPLLVITLYNFGIWTVGIAAMFMIIIGGFMYASSAGNTASTSKAKSFITDAFIGLIGALVAWLFLYVINPDLTKLNLSMVTTSTGEQALTAEQVMQPDGSYPISNKPLPKGCASYKETFKKVAASTGISACELEAIAATESSCNPVSKSATNSKGTFDCGIVQINSANFPAGQDKNAYCQKLQNDPALAMEMGAKIYKSSYAGKIGNRKLIGDPKFKDSQIMRDRYAAYNGGDKALNKSKDCPETGAKNLYGNPFLAYDCPINNVGFKNTPNNTSRFLNFYARCNGITIYK